jgi:hypothetical protein
MVLDESTLTEASFLRNFIIEAPISHQQVKEWLADLKEQRLAG